VATRIQGYRDTGIHHEHANLLMDDARWIRVKESEREFQREFPYFSKMDQ